MVDQRVDSLRLVGMDHQSWPLVRQEKVFVLVNNIQVWLKNGEEEIFLFGLVKELIFDL